MKLLITGGAGYIGSHVVRAAEAAGHECVVVDNLSTGLAARVKSEIVELNLSDSTAQAQLESLMNKYKFDSVIHLAALKQVGVSVQEPETYFAENLGGLANLLLAMRNSNLTSLVFSSSAATYGMPDVDAVSEDYSGVPINPYGQTKLIGEWMVRNAKVWGLRGVSLRYFNVAGCGFPDLADTAALNLIPIAIEAIKAGKSPKVFGDDYPTPDGSCIRDYVHVQDLAEAHVAAVSYLERQDHSVDTFNVGTSQGASVFEVLAELRRASGIEFELDVLGRRAGDPPRLIANVELIEKVLGFKAKNGLKEIVQSAWDAS